uniref:Plant heme peroxidase family profile domain-containing protein n=1 Tax=Arundo donax TaxID=35708 RepID=A0A0A9E7F1_ARUDO
MAVVFPTLRARPPLPLASAVVVLLVGSLARGTGAQLSAGFYSASCPTVHSVVRQVMSQAVMNDTRSGAAILRLFFHDCFVNGCDASLLLDDTPATPGEKGAGPSAGPNAGGSTFGFDLIDTIKTQVESACPATVSCADILALAARDAVNLVRPSCFSALALCAAKLHVSNNARMET